MINFNGTKNVNYANKEVFKAVYLRIRIVDLEDESITFLRNFGISLPLDIVSNPKRTEPSYSNQISYCRLALNILE